MSHLTGKCHCGKNTYTVTAAPAFQFVCYCTNCRVLNSGGHLCGMMFDDSQLIKAEATQQYTYLGGSERSIILHFCPQCATHLYAYPTQMKGKVVIRANTLTESNFQSQQSLFPESAFAWDQPV